jgi:hypothetical protein
MDNLKLLLGLEEMFYIHFSIEELSENKSIQAIIIILKNKGIYENK